LDEAQPTATPIKHTFHNLEQCSVVAAIIMGVTAASVVVIIVITQLLHRPARDGPIEPEAQTQHLADVSIVVIVPTVIAMLLPDCFPHTTQLCCCCGGGCC